MRCRWICPWSNLVKIRQIDWLECLRGGLMQLKGILGLYNLPALHPWAQIKIVHRQSGHPGVQWTLYFVRQIALGVSKAAVKTVVREWEECQSIDPAPVHWSKGALNVKQTWHWVAMDITHCNGAHFLMVTDCSSARFAIWQRLPWQDATSVINQLNVLFYERGPPAEILTDNDTAFQSSLLKAFLDEWRVRLWFRCAYVPSGNSIVKRCHRTVKRIAARKWCTIPEAVYWYNVMPKDDMSSTTAPANMVDRYCIWLKGINGTSVPTHNSRLSSNQVTECG